jgi:hypothetical protein
MHWHQQPQRPTSNHRIPKLVIVGYDVEKIGLAKQSKCSIKILLLKNEHCIIPKTHTNPQKASISLI